MTNRQESAEVRLFKWMKRIAEQGDAKAQSDLALMYHSGEGVPKNYKEAAKWYRKAAKQGHVKAQWNLGQMYRKGEGVPQDYVEAYAWYLLAKADETFASITIPDHEKRLTAEQKKKGQARAAEIKAEQGDAEAQNNLGVMYCEGKGVPEDNAEAFKWFRKAAEQGHDSAQYNLGQMYREGEGVPQDDVEAAKWYRKAAEQGNGWAQFNLGLMYDRGQGVPQGHGEAFKWFRKAAEQGQFTLGRMFEEVKALGMLGTSGKGEVVPLDDLEAFKWYRKAAEQGHAGAQCMLGWMYYRCENFGASGPYDPEEAAKWFRKAAEQGDAEAQLELGRMYGNGEGVPKDEVEAYAWFLVAKANEENFERPNEKEEVSKLISNFKKNSTAEQVEKGQARAAELHRLIEQKSAE